MILLFVVFKREAVIANMKRNTGAAIRGARSVLVAARRGHQRRLEALAPPVQKATNRSCVPLPSRPRRGTYGTSRASQLRAPIVHLILSITVLSAGLLLGVIQTYFSEIKLCPMSTRKHLGNLGNIAVNDNL